MRIENPMVIHMECEDDTERTLELCANCKCRMKHGDTYYFVFGDYFCNDCVETGELDEADY